MAPCDLSAVCVAPIGIADIDHAGISMGRCNHAFINARRSDCVYECMVGESNIACVGKINSRAIYQYRKDSAPTVARRRDAMTVWKAAVEVCGSTDVNVICQKMRNFASDLSLACRKARRFQAELLLALAEGESV